VKTTQFGGVLAILVVTLASPCPQTSLAQQEKPTSKRKLNVLKPSGTNAANQSKSTDSTATSDTKPNLVVQLAHVQVGRAVFSRDGNLVLTCGGQTIGLWDVATGRELRGFSPSSGVTSIALSPDGRFALSGSNDRAARLWDVATGKEVRRFPGESTAVTAVAFSPDGRQILTGGDDGSLIVWDVATGQPSRILEEWQHAGPPSCISCALFSPDGRFILAGSSDCRVGTLAASARLWDAATGREVHRFDGFARLNYGFGVNTAAFSPDSRFVLLSIVSEPSRSELFDLTTMRKVWELPDSVNASEFSPDGKLIAIANFARAELLDAATGKLVRPLYVDNHTVNYVTTVAFSPDGRFLLTGFKGNALLWDAGTGNIAKRFEGRANSVSSVEISPDGRFVLCEPSDPLIDKEIAVLWDTETGSVTRTFTLEIRHSPIKTHPVFSLDGRFLLTSDNRLRDLSSGETTVNFEKYLDDMLSVAVSPDGRYLAIGDRKNKARLIDVRTGAEVRRFQAPVRQNFISDMSSVAFSGDGRFLLTGSWEATSGNARLWDVATGTELRRFDAQDAVTTVAFSPDARSVLAGSRDGTATLWDRATGAELSRFQGHKKTVNSVTFSSDGKFVLTAGSDDSARLWDASTGKEIRRFVGHAGGVHSARFSSDGRFVWTGAGDFTTRLWDVSTGRELCRLISFRDGSWVAVDPEGRFDTNTLDEIKDLHWVVPDDPFKPLPLEIFMREYYEPRLLQRIVAGEKFKPVKSLSELNRVQPKVRIESIQPEPNADTVAVTVEVSRMSGAIQKAGKKLILETGVYDLRLFRDGQLVRYAPEAGGEIRTDTKTGKAVVRFTGIRLPQRANEKRVQFSAYAFNIDKVKSATDSKTFDLPQELTPVKGRAYLITVGVNAYEQKDFDLSFAANDARRVQSIVYDKLSSGGEYDEVVTIPLISDYETKSGRKIVTETTATKSNLRSVLDLLSGKQVASAMTKSIPNADKLRQARPEDLVLISFSSHGFADDNGIFYFVPYDTGQVKEEKITPELIGHCISSDELATWLRDVDAGEMVMIADACHSAATVDVEGFKPGPMGSRGLGQLAYDKRMRILTSTQSNDVALESELIKQGLLTYALTHDGIEAGQADFKPKDRVITLGEWLEYGVSRVPSLYEEVKRGELKSFGRGEKRGLVVGSTRKTDSSEKKKAYQQPSLFDFSRRKDDVVLVKAN
jgi:WD40 repeat protein